ncbi:MAG: 6-pyruvoyl tetrahydrobiopterin synthase [Candidatus Lindowbacteria bacterium RIFCSPLOWO2_12_FULL_62_27]|nr:MAG: 6-pyruvoyl tetrahydrobiopterin synthase [Candidatus Lindowbacteria bacterium RIFCSPLOWO2_12_FULL_62_27]OGH63941.1 MAG: 6-pyruvoyl tetrahydrobiopterin synthase [Candidatus Lindowbacteria bacterium RIFCSPLOWO2_02_FULL_62_12]
MFTVTKEIHFCYGHRLMNYDGQCKHPHGHNGRAAFEMSADRLDARGMVTDFTDIKNSMKAWIDREIDHKMLLRKDDPAVEVLRKMGEPVFVMDQNPTAESIAKLFYEKAKEMGFPVVRVSVWETDTSVASYAGR